MLKCESAYLMFIPITIADAEQDIIAQAILDKSVKTLADVENLINWRSLPPIQVENQTYVVTSGVNFQEEADNGVTTFTPLNDGVVYSTPLTAFLALLRYKQLAIEKNQLTAYKLGQVNRQLDSMREYGIATALLPNDLIAIDEGSVYIKDTFQGYSISLLNSQVPSANVLGGALSSEYVLRDALGQFTNFSPTVETLFIEELMSMTEVPAAVYNSDIGFTRLSDSRYALITFDATQTAMIRSMSNVGFAPATFCYILNELGSFKDPGGHTKRIKEYLEAFNKLRGYAEDFSSLTDKIDLSIGGSMVDYLVPNGNIAETMYDLFNSLAILLPNSDEITVDVVNEGDDPFFASRIRAALKFPVSVVRMPGIALEKQPDNTVNVTFDGMTFNVKFGRSSLAVAYHKLIGMDPDMIRPYFDLALLLADAIYDVKNGSNVVISSELMSIERSNVSVMISSRPYVRSRNSVIKRSEKV